jgi:hypothetical protein
MELYRSTENKIRTTKPDAEVISKVTASAYVCGEKMKKAIRKEALSFNNPEYVLIGGKKYNVDTLCFKIDLMAKIQTINAYRLFLNEGLPGLVAGLTYNKGSVKKTVKKKTTVKKTK